MIDNPKVQNSSISGGFVPTKEKVKPVYTPEAAAALNGRELDIKVPTHNFAKEALPVTMGMNRMNPTLELHEMTINGLLVPGLHLGYAAMRAPMRKTPIEVFQKSQKVVHLGSENKCPYAVITIVDGETLYLFGQVPQTKIVEARFISWKQIKELNVAYEKTRADIQARKDAIEKKRAEAAEAIADAQPEATTVVQDEIKQPL